MFSRRLRSMLPSTNEQLAPQSIDPNKIRKTMQDFQIKTKVNYDRTARKLSPLKVGESVHVQRDKLWEPAKVVSQHNEHSYNVQTPQGANYRRNRKFLNKTPSSPQVMSSPAIKIPAKVPDAYTKQPPPTCIQSRSGRQVRPNPKYIGDDWEK